MDVYAKDLLLNTKKDFISFFNYYVSFYEFLYTNTQTFVYIIIIYIFSSTMYLYNFLYSYIKNFRYIYLTCCYSYYNTDKKQI